MKRRDFIQVMLPMAGLPIVWPMWSFSKPLRKLGGSSYPLNFPDDGRVLVLVQCAGGNDGLNTIVPYTNDIYYKERPQLAIPKPEIIDINGEIGFHQAMTGFQSLFGDGNLGIVQGVGYPNPDRSHFRSTDIWLTGSGSDEVGDTGWLGRYFDLICPEGAECGTYGPPAIQIGLTSSLALLGREQKGITLQNPVQFYELARRIGNTHDPQPTIQPATPAEHELEFLRDTEAAAFQFAGEIVEAFEKNQNQVQYPNESLASQLSIVSRLIVGGLSTRIYIVTIRGFDTHANQGNRHAQLLGDLSTAILLFLQELELFGVADRVAGLCFSEFGRRVRQNASQGTDHGTAAPLFLFGNPVVGQVYGPHPSLNDLQNGDLIYQFDYRQIYASLLEQWLGASATDVLGEAFTTLPLIDATTDVQRPSDIPNDFFLAQNYPNPFNPATTIEYTIPRSAHVKLEILNSLGQRVAVLVNSRKEPGKYQVSWQSNGHSSGTYIYRIKAGDFQQTRRMTLVK
ncbi:MAG: DUF1501 domain-containing protein [bacterium]